MTKKRSPREKKQSIEQSKAEAIKTLHNAILSLQEAFANDILDFVRRRDVARQYQNELIKLERRYRNDAIFFWIGTVILGGMIGLFLNLIF